MSFVPYVWLLVTDIICIHTAVPTILDMKTAS